MANSKYEYVKKFELDDTLLPGCWIVIRLDGKGFTKFTSVHNFEKPDDLRGLNLMNHAAKDVLRAFPDVRIAFGESDEYSFVFDKATRLYGRRASKLVSLVTSCFTASYVHNWSTYLPTEPLQLMPLFDGRAVCYPTDDIMRDYLAWRQADTHINCQYNSCFWALVKSGKTQDEAQNTLKGTQKDFKNELLFSLQGVNYNNLPEQFRKGSVVIRCKTTIEHTNGEKTRLKEVMEPTVLHVDIIKDKFWNEHSKLLE